MTKITFESNGMVQYVQVPDFYETEKMRSELETIRNNFNAIKKILKERLLMEEEELSDLITFY